MTQTHHRDAKQLQRDANLLQRRKTTTNIVGSLLQGPIASYPSMSMCDDRRVCRCLVAVLIGHGGS